MLASLDGYIEDEEGKFDWAEPDEEVHSAFNELERASGTALYGRGMYETMSYWETVRDDGSHPPHIVEFGELWRATDKVVYSRTLDEATTERTRLEREFNPEAVQGMKAESERSLSVGGPGLAAAAFAAGLVDEVHLFLVPFLTGGGKPALPHGIRRGLELLDERRFGDGTVQLHYRVLK